MAHPRPERPDGWPRIEVAEGIDAVLAGQRCLRRPHLRHAPTASGSVAFPAQCCTIKWMKGEGYVSERDGGYWVSDTRVSLDSVVYAFLQGQTAESIAQSFPLLTLEQVYGAITFYLAHRAEIDAYLHEGRLDYERLMEANRRADPAFYQKLIDARQRQP
ncbi:MAG TPA: DUF433 domain-containing protein [Thermoanaerobaculia bacterium]|nr:DUF433 domain-containing protein [Thermoanaerobaculia bacterium]